MPRIVCLLSLIVILGSSVVAQQGKPRLGGLPAGISEWSGEDSDRLLDDPAITMRLKMLLGRKNYASFIASFETLTPIGKDRDTLFASGCLIHACTHLESAIAVDLSSNTIHAAIYNDERKTRYFNERGSKTPDPIREWAHRLSDLKK